jgi:hypothetical protein
MGLHGAHRTAQRNRWLGGDCSGSLPGKHRFRASCVRLCRRRHWHRPPAAVLSPGCHGRTAEGGIILHVTRRRAFWLQCGRGPRTVEGAATPKAKQSRHSLQCGRGPRTAEGGGSPIAASTSSRLQCGRGPRTAEGIDRMPAGRKRTKLQCGRGASFLRWCPTPFGINERSTRR